MRAARHAKALVIPCLLAAACGESASQPAAPAPKPTAVACQSGVGVAPDFLSRLDCKPDFDVLASDPVNASIPGARAVKVVVDGRLGDAVYFQNSKKYKIHYEFASAHLSGNGKPIVPALMKFNETEYYSDSRRFILGSITYYEGPKVWSFEIAPYDTADDKMIARAYDAIVKATFFGKQLFFHPTSVSVERVVPALPARIKIKTTAELFAEIDYQPLNLATAIGKLRLISADELQTAYVNYRDIVVLDRTPNDISVVSGIITEEFQTPLSHINVLSQNRRTPNMGLRNATQNPKLKLLEGKWVRLVVGAFDWTAEEATMADADAWWEGHKPQPVQLPVVDLAAREIRDVGDLVADRMPLRDAIKAAIPAYGGKAAHYSILARTAGVPTPKAFAVPAYYYVDFMEKNGLYRRIDELLADPEFRDQPAIRDGRLKDFREQIKLAPVDEGFQKLLRAKLDADFPGAMAMRFRTSTNSEDLDGFPCAGCYESHTGRPADWDSVLTAIRKAWSSIWLFRTFEERAYHSIDHKSVVMALLVHRNFPDEEANGVALTANPFDPSGSEPGVYVNVQKGGDAEVVHPPAGVTSDEFIYGFRLPGQPLTYISRSSLVEAGGSVLSRTQIFKLGSALDAIHKRFSPAYGPEAGNRGWYAMDVEFKFDGEPGQEPELFIKQARPHPGRGK